MDMFVKMELVYIQYVGHIKYIERCLADLGSESSLSWQISVEWDDVVPEKAGYPAW